MVTAQSDFGQIFGIFLISVGLHFFMLFVPVMGRTSSGIIGLLLILELPRLRIPRTEAAGP